MATALTDEAKQKITNAYQTFLGSLREIEKNYHVSAAKILSTIDEKKVDDLQRRIQTAA